MNTNMPRHEAQTAIPKAMLTLTKEAIYKLGQRLQRFITRIHY